MIFDPFSGNLDGTGRSVFSSGGQVNVIPQARLNAPMMKLLALVPLPNQPGDTDNYFNSGTQRLNRNNVDAKVNWNRNERHQLWFKYSVMDALVHGDFSLGEAGGDCLCGGGIGDGSHARADRGHRADLHRLAHLPDRRHVRLDAVRPGRGAAGPRHQLRIGRARDSRHQRPRSARKRHAAACTSPAFRRSAIPRAGARSTATTSPTPSTPMRAG